MSKLSRWVLAQPDTVAETAKRIGVGRVALYRYMSGASMPRPAAIRRIAEVSGVTADDLQRDYVRS